MKFLNSILYSAVFRGTLTLAILIFPSTAEPSGAPLSAHKAVIKDARRWPSSRMKSGFMPTTSLGLSTPTKFTGDLSHSRTNSRSFYLLMRYRTTCTPASSSPRRMNA